MIKPEKLEQEVVDLLLPRLADEYRAFYAYRAASNYCQGVGYFKAAEFFAKESADELEHAKGIEAYLNEWNVFPDLPTVEKPKIMFKDLPEVIDTAYKLELALYEEYEDTASKIMKMGDVCTFNFLLKYNAIQQSSVAEYSDKINMLDGVNTDKMNLLLLEEKLFS